MGVPKDIEFHDAPTMCKTQQTATQCGYGRSLITVDFLQWCPKR
jgi:hypothetical protein